MLWYAVDFFLYVVYWHKIFIPSKQADTKKQFKCVYNTCLEKEVI